MAIVCANCQTPNDDTNRFCFNCGSPLAAPAPAAPPPASVSPAAPPITAEPVAAPPQPAQTAEPVAAAAAAPPPPATQPIASAPAPAAPPPTPAPAPPTYAQPQPLAAAAAPAPAWPYGAPAPGAPPRSVVRLPANLLIAGVIAALLGTATIGVVIGALLNKDGDNSGPIASATTPGPAATPTGDGGSGPTAGPPVTPDPGRPTPTPGGPTPTPEARTPTPTPGGGGGGGGGGATQTVDVKYIAVQVPSAWKVLFMKDDFVGVLTPHGGVYFASGPYSTTVDQAMAGLLEYLKKQFPDVKVCAEPKDSKVTNGPAGKFVAYCYTAAYQDGTKYKAVDAYWIGVDSAGNLFELNIFTDREGDLYKQTIDDFNNGVTALRWKLYSGQ